MHIYQLMQQTRRTRKMDHCRLIDETHLPLKNFAAVDSNKETMSEFQSTFVKPQKQISKRTELGLLKVKGAEFIVSILDDIRQCKGQALKVPKLTLLKQHNFLNQVNLKIPRMPFVNEIY